MDGTNGTFEAAGADAAFEGASVLSLQTFVGLKVQPNFRVKKARLRLRVINTARRLWALHMPLRLLPLNMLF